jgi:hypothetical protein
MDQVVKFHIQLTTLQGLIWFKRSLRMLFRMIWLGISGYIIGWGLNELTGWFPEPRIWLLFCIMFAIPPFIIVLFSWPNKKRLSWFIDRKLGLKEQISTALNASKSYPENTLVRALIDDTLHIFPWIWRRLLFYGWNLSRDLIAFFIVLLLAVGVYVYRFIPITSTILPDTELELLPPLGEETSAKDIFPLGVLGLQPTPTDEQDNTEGDANNTSSLEKQSDYYALQEALLNMGEQLSQSAATFELGQALQNGNAENSAEAMEDLSDHVNSLDTTTKELLSQAMLDASTNISSTLSPEIKKLSEDLLETSNQIQEQLGDSSGGDSATNAGTTSPDFSTQDAMDEVASDLRTLGNLTSSPGGFGAGIGNIDSEQGSIEPADRIQGGADVYQLDSSEAFQSGILIPANTDQEGLSSTNVSMDFTSVSGNQIIQTPLVPSTYPWKWRNVVSTYFLSR